MVDLANEEVGEISLHDLRMGHMTKSVLWNVGGLKSVPASSIVTIVVDENGQPMAEKTEQLAALKLINAEAVRLRQQRDELVKKILK